MTLDEAAEHLNKGDDFVVISHDGPDADGLGAAYALTLALRAMGKRAFAAVADAVPAKFAFIDRRSLFLSLASPTLPFDPTSTALVIVDTHDMHYLGTPSERLLGSAKSVLVIDHHEPREGLRSEALIDPASSSSSELVCVLVDKLGVSLPVDAAAALFAGIVYDTGSFAYAKTSARTFACAHSLVAAGVKPYDVHMDMYESSSTGVLILQKSVLATLELFAEGRVAVQSLSKKALEDSGATYEDAEDLVNIPLRSGQVEVSVLFKENTDGRLRCSMRSKGGINVARIAQSFGGGGHRSAAGFTCALPLERSKADVLESTAKALSGG